MSENISLGVANWWVSPCFNTYLFNKFLWKYFQDGFCVHLSWSYSSFKSHCFLDLLNNEGLFCKKFFLRPQVNYFFKEPWFSLMDNRICLSPGSLVNRFWCHLRAAQVRELESEAEKSGIQGRKMLTQVFALR